MFGLLLLLPLAFQVDHAAPRIPVAGILEMPEIFGEFPCASYDPVGYEVFDSPSAEGVVLGTLEVVRGWYADEASPCEWIEVAFLDGAAATEKQIPSMEFSYEQPGLIVLERQLDWFRVHLGSRSGWILPADPDAYRAYEQLVRESLAYVKEGWTGELRAAPANGSATRVPEEWLRYLRDDLTVEVLEDRVVDGELWFKLRLDPAYGCGTLPGDPPAVEGWVPAYGPSGENTIWFHSRGC